MVGFNRLFRTCYEPFVIMIPGPTINNPSIFDVLRELSDRVICQYLQTIDLLGLRICQNLSLVTERSEAKTKTELFRSEKGNEKPSQFVISIHFCEVLSANLLGSLPYWPHWGVLRGSWEDATCCRKK